MSTHTKRTDDVGNSSSKTTETMSSGTKDGGNKQVDIQAASVMMRKGRTTCLLKYNLLKA